MSSTNKGSLHDTSPHSSSAGPSAYGTPDTHLTSMTPEERSNKLDRRQSNYGSQERLRFGVTTHGFTSHDKDPFVSTFKGEQKLSPTASTFQPFGLHLQSFSAGPMVVSSPEAVAQLDSVPKVSVSDPSSPATSQCSNTTQMGTFSTDTSVTRALRVSGIYGPVLVEHVEACIQELLTLVAGKRLFRIGNDVFVRLLDVCDAQRVYSHLKMVHPEWAIDYILPSGLAKRLDPRSAFVSSHEGQVCLSAVFPGNADRSKLERIMLDLLSIDGNVYAYQKQLATEAGNHKLIAEFSDISCAGHAVERLNGATVRGIQIKVGYHRPDLDRKATEGQVRPITPKRTNNADSDFSSAFQSMSLNTPKGASISQQQQGCPAVLSPTGRSFVPGPYPMSPAYSGAPFTYGNHFSTVPTLFGYTPPETQLSPSFNGEPFMSTPYTQTNVSYWDNFGNSARGGGQVPLSSGRMVTQGRRQNAMRVSNRSPFNNPAGHHNVVDIDRIQEGSDVRTTIMLRNIPNKIDQAMLKAIIDETSFGLYDFMYLRIDFANNCNVGYAFINFQDPYSIIDFVNARAGQRWNRYNSDKVAEVSYATIQGKDCLVQKFRNSSVMLESPAYRPKIYHTKGTPEEGQEEAFPTPDNASKMRRSVENAEHVGLFAPRAGQHYRDEQRRRRSQYDRGTRLAALEEFDFDESKSLTYGGGSYNY